MVCGHTIQKRPYLILLAGDFETDDGSPQVGIPKQGELVLVLLPCGTFSPSWDSSVFICEGWTSVLQSLVLPHRILIFEDLHFSFVVIQNFSCCSSLFLSEVTSWPTSVQKLLPLSPTNSSSSLCCVFGPVFKKCWIKRGLSAACSPLMSSCLQESALLCRCVWYRCMRSM